MKLGAPSFIVGALGVVAPFFIGCFVFVAMDVASLPAIIIVVTALTATIIAISVQVLNDLGRLHSREGRLILGATAADDVLAIAVLSVVLNMVRTGNISSDINGVVLSVLQILGIYAAILVTSVFAIPHLLNWGSGSHMRALKLRP
ncbi:MAG: cation:proton antiporter [Thermoproteota archaeon]